MKSAWCWPSRPHQEEAVRETLARDPWHETHLVVDSVDSWTIRLDGRGVCGR